MKDKKCFIDTNIFLYSFIMQDEQKKKKSDTILQYEMAAISTQVIREVLANIFKKKILINLNLIMIKQ